MFELAYNLKYQRKINDLLNELLNNPDDDFVKFIMTKLEIKSKSKSKVNLFKKLIISSCKKLIAQVIKDTQEFFSSSEDNNEEFTDQEKEKRNIQDRYIILDGKKISIRTAKEILINTAEWLIRKEYIRKEECPINFSKKRNLISVNKKHNNGRVFISPFKLSNGLFIETNYSTDRTIQLSKFLLKKYGFSPDILEINFK